MQFFSSSKWTSVRCFTPLQPSTRKVKKILAKILLCLRPIIITESQNSWGGKKPLEVTWLCSQAGPPRQLQLCSECRVSRQLRSSGELWKNKCYPGDWQKVLSLTIAFRGGSCTSKAQAVLLNCQKRHGGFFNFQLSKLLFQWITWLGRCTSFLRCYADLSRAQRSILKLPKLSSKTTHNVSKPGKRKTHFYTFLLSWKRLSSPHIISWGWCQDENKHSLCKDGVMAWGCTTLFSHATHLNSCLM